MEIYVPEAVVFLAVFVGGVVTGALGLVAAALWWSRRR